MITEVRWKSLNDYQKQALLAGAGFAAIIILYKLYWMNIIHEIKNFLCDGREQLKYQVNKLPPYISALKKQDIIDILTTE